MLFKQADNCMSIFYKLVELRSYFRNRNTRIGQQHFTCCGFSSTFPVFLMLIDLALKYGCVADARIAPLTRGSSFSDVRFPNLFLENHGSYQLQEVDNI